MNSESSGNNKQHYDLYAQYKKTESLAFDILFRSQSWRDWSLKQFLSTAARVTPTLPQRNRESLIRSFERSIKIARSGLCIFALLLGSLNDNMINGSSYYTA